MPHRSDWAPTDSGRQIISTRNFMDDCMALRSMFVSICAAHYVQSPHSNADRGRDGRCRPSWHRAPPLRVPSNGVHCQETRSAPRGGTTRRRCMSVSRHETVTPPPHAGCSVYCRETSVYRQAIVRVNRTALGCGHSFRVVIRYPRAHGMNVNASTELLIMVVPSLVGERGAAGCCWRRTERSSGNQV